MKIILISSLFLTPPMLSFSCEKQERAYSEAENKMNEAKIKWEKTVLKEEQSTSNNGKILNELKKTDTKIKQAFINFKKIETELDKISSEWEKSPNGKKATEMMQSTVLIGAFTGISIAHSKEGNKLMEDILNQYGSERIKKTYAKLKTASAKLEKALKKHPKGREHINIYNKIRKKYDKTFKTFHSTIDERNKAWKQLESCKKENDTIACRLEYISRTLYDNGKIINKAYKETARFSSIFTGLQSDNPKMIQPDKIDLVKIKEFNGVYWFASPTGIIGTVLFIIDTKNKVMIQQRSRSLGEKIYGQSWLGKCI